MKLESELIEDLHKIHNFFVLRQDCRTGLVMESIVDDIKESVKNSS